MHLFSCFLVVFCFAQTNSQFYSSTDKLRDLFEFESEVLDDIVDVINQINEVGDYLKEKVTTWLDEHVAAEKNVKQYLTNPLNAFLLIKRNVYDVQLVQNKLSTFVDNLRSKLRSLDKKKIVDKKEVNGAVGGIIRVQRAYHLKCEDLVEGIIEDVKTRNPLTSHDIYVLAAESYQMLEENYFSKVYFKIVAENLRKLEQFHGDINETEVAEKLQGLEQKNLVLNFDKILNENPVNSLTRKICRGSLTRLPKEIKTLRCRYVSFSPFSSIALFKLEEANIDPYIVIYHEIISESEINQLLQLTRPKQAQAKIGFGTSEKIENKSRLGQVAWITNREHKILSRFNARFEDMTGLTMETAEALQVQNYGIGGHFNAHYDHNENRTDPSSDDRLATLLIYLSDVEKGGATVFPRLKLRVEPKKGSAVFWYNFKHSGHNDPNTLHSGCPVLLGSKWVANKWIHNIGQEFKRRCKPDASVN